MKTNEAMKLQHPLELGKLTISELKFRAYATAEDLLAFDEKGPNLQTIALIASLTGNDVELIKKLHHHDLRRADKIASEMIKPEADEKNESES